jgi:hypothetical protein
MHESKSHLQRILMSQPVKALALGAASAALISALFAVLTRTWQF